MVSERESNSQNVMRNNAPQENVARVVRPTVSNRASGESKGRSHPEKQAKGTMSFSRLIGAIRGRGLLVSLELC